MDVLSEKPKLTSDEALDRGLADRLRKAIDQSGGPAAVSKLSDIPLSTVSNYLNGTEPRFSRVAHLAKVCKVSLDWLATGDGPMHPDQHRAPATEGASIESLGFNREQLDSAGNFWAMFTLTRSCQEWYEKNGITPTLHNILKWVGSLYGNFSELPDLPVEFMSPDESLALRNARLAEGK